MAIRSSSGEIFFFPAKRSLITSSRLSLSKLGGSTMSKISSISDCLTIQSMRQDRQSEGEALISMRWQPPSVSIMMSQPKSSNAVGKGGTEMEQPKSDLMMIQCTCAHTLLKEQPILVILSLSTFKEILLPPEKAAVCLASQLLRLMAKLVRCTKVFLMNIGSRLNFSVLNLAKPSLQTNASRGWKFVTSTQILMSNLQPSNSKGLMMYFWTIMLSVQFSSARLLMTFMPLPRDLPMGFMIQQFRSRLTISSSWNLMLNCVNSLGRLQVSGRKLKGILSIFLKESRFLQRRSFLDRFLLKGKWLIFCQMRSLLMSMSGLLHDQKRFQELRSEQPWGSSFHSFLRRKPVEMMSYTSSLVLTTRQQRLLVSLNCPCRLPLKISNLSTNFFKLTQVFSAWRRSCLGSLSWKLLEVSKGKKTAGLKQLALSLKCCWWVVNMLVRSFIIIGMSCSAWCSALVYITEKIWLKVGQIQRQLKLGKGWMDF